MINLIAFLIPVFFLIIAIEWFVSWKRGDQKYTTDNSLMNMSLGLIDQISQLGYFVIFYFVLDGLYQNFRLFTLPMAWYHWVLAFIAIDFVSYWYHRFSHEVNIFWAAHVTHHSSELYNLTVSFRISIFQGINRIFFWLILPLLGFSPVILMVCFKIAGLYQFFLHTEYIEKMGVLEKFLITPSQHRVHHGKNDIYIDKNYGSFFNIWDRLFGTFQEETEPVEYGIKSTYEDNHPLLAIGHHYLYLFNMIKNTSKWSDKIKLIFMPPGWLPTSTENIEIKPVAQRCSWSHHFKSYAYFQVVGAVVGLILMLAFKDFLTTIEMIIFGNILIHSIVKSTLIIKENLTAKWLEREFTILFVELALILAIMFVIPQFYHLLVLAFVMMALIILQLKLNALTLRIAPK